MLNGGAKLDKFKCIQKFIQAAVEGSNSKLSSEIFDHKTSVKLFSNTYMAGAMEFNQMPLPYIIDFHLV